MLIEADLPKLETFDIDPRNGFLPANEPLKQLPTYYAAWEELASQIQPFLNAGAFRKHAEKMEVLSIEFLQTKPELERAYLLLSVFANAAVWEGKAQASTVPACIAVPLYAVAQKLERPPILTYSSIVLANWQVLDKTKPIELGNIATLMQFQGGMDEAWFYLITVDMEAKGAPALQALIDLKHAAATKNRAEAQRALKVIEGVLKELLIVFNRIHERCDPYIFFNRVRPWLSSFTSIKYEGVKGAEAENHFGGSAAQSSLIQAFDAGLGVAHDHEHAAFYLRKMRTYMPKQHREYLEWLETDSEVQAFCSAHLETEFRKVVNALVAFRNKHLSVVKTYIMAQGTKAGPGATGTGGTNPMTFLTQVRDAARAASEKS